jgi:hypothetical protein
MTISSFRERLANAKEPTSRSLRRIVEKQIPIINCYNVIVFDAS